MSQTDRIKIEKITFLQEHSEVFYNELFNKDEDNNSTIFLITSLLLKQDSLEECSEYDVLNKIVDMRETVELENSFLANILTTITQFLTKIGAIDSVEVILSYFKYNQTRDFAKEKTLCLA